MNKYVTTTDGEERRMMKDKNTPSKAQLRHWEAVGKWAMESGNAGTKAAGKRVLQACEKGENVIETCRTAYEIALRVWA